MRRRNPATWLVLGAASAALALGACGDDGPPAGVRIEILVPTGPVQRPDSVRFFWLGPAGVMLQGRLPEAGALPAQGSPLASLFVATGGPLGSPRALALNGYFGGVVVAGVFLRVAPGPESSRLVQVTLGPPLVDSDADGIPDVVALGCAAVGIEYCGAPDGGVPDGGDAGAGAGDGGPQPGGDAAGPGTPPVDGAAVPPAGDAGVGADVRAADVGSPVPEAGPPGPTDALVPSDAPPDRPPLPPDSGGPYALGDGVIGYWRFDDPAGSATARDFSGRGHTGGLFEGTPNGWTTDGRLDGALGITAPGQGVRVAPTTDFQSLGAGFTLAAWTRRLTLAPGRASVLSRPSAERADRAYVELAFSPTGHLEAIVNGHLDPAPVAASPDPLPLRQWMHVAMTYDGASIAVYVNGVESRRVAYAQALGNANMPLCLGCAFNQPNALTPDEPLGGDLDELLLYNRVLNPTELVRLTAGEQPQIRN